MCLRVKHINKIWIEVLISMNDNFQLVNDNV